MLTSSCLSYNNLFSPSEQKTITELPLNSGDNSSSTSITLKESEMNCDKAIFSSEAKALAANLASNGTSNQPEFYTSEIFLEKSTLSPESVSGSSAVPGDNIVWGPDLIEGWNTEGYLETTDDGFKGSLSFTTKFGSKVGLSAGEPDEEGKPSQVLNLVMQRKDGTMFTHTFQKTAADFEASNIRITEFGDDFKVAYGPEATKGTDKDDIIIAMGGRVEAGEGDDVIIGLRNTTVFGGRGDDSIVMLENSKMAENLTRGPQILIAGDKGDDRIFVNNLSGVFSHISGSGSPIDDCTGDQDTIAVNRLGKDASISNCANGVSQDIKIALLDGGMVDLYGSNSTYNLVLNEATDTRKGWSHITFIGENNTITANVDKLRRGAISIDSKNSTVDINVNYIGKEAGLAIGADGSITNAHVGKLHGAVLVGGDGKNNIKIDSAQSALLLASGGDNHFKIGNLSNSLIYLAGGASNIKADKASGNVAFDAGGGSSFSSELMNSFGDMYFGSKDKKKFEQWARQFISHYAGGVNYGI